jgi:hypothetical protein
MVDTAVGESPDMKLPAMPPVASMLAKPVAAIPPGQFYEPKWTASARSCPRRRRGGDRKPQGAADDPILPGVLEAIRRNFRAHNLPRIDQIGVIARSSDMTHLA